MTEWDLAAIVESALGLTTGLDLVPRLVAADDDCPLGACIQFTGEWNGAVVVSCDTTFATRTAGFMFGCEPDAVGRPDVDDALGELANVIAGNVKPLLPQPTLISLPTVVSGDGVHLGVPGATAICTVAFGADDTKVAVTLYRGNDKESG